MGSSQFQVRRGFMGLVIFYRDHTDTVPVIKDVESLEYELTSRLTRMTRRHKKVIALLHRPRGSQLAGLPDETRSGPLPTL